MPDIAEKTELLGPPQIRLAGLQIWVHGRESPDRNDYWDGNWLSVTAHCGAHGGDVWADGPILHLSEIKDWYNALVVVDKTLAGKARLGGDLEPNLRVQVQAEGSGHVGIRVEITPDHMAQQHSFEFKADQTFLSSVLRQCKALLSEYPIRDEPRVQK